MKKFLLFFFIFFFLPLSLFSQTSPYVTPTPPTTGYNPYQVPNIQWVQSVIGINTSRFVINPTAAGCNGIVPGTSTNIASAVNSAVTAGYTDVVIPSNCLYQPTGNVTPNDVTIEGTDWEHVVIASSSPTSNWVSMGARSTLKNMSKQDAFCYNGWGVANSSRICPFNTIINNSDSSWIPDTYPGVGFYVHSDNVTYAGVTSTAGNSGQPFVSQCLSSDCFYAEADNTSATPYRGVATVDTPTFLTLQYSSDGYGANQACKKFRGTIGSPTTVVSNDIACQYEAYAYDGTNALDLGGILFQVVGSVSTGHTTGNAVIRVQGTGGSIVNAFQLNASNGTVLVAGNEVADFNGDLFAQHLGATGLTFDTSASPNFLANYIIGSPTSDINMASLYDGTSICHELNFGTPGSAVTGTGNIVNRFNIRSLCVGQGLSIINSFESITFENATSFPAGVDATNPGIGSDGTNLVFGAGTTATDKFKATSTGNITGGTQTACAANTPSIAFGGGTSGMTYSTRACNYQVIGKQVFMQFYIQFTAKGSSTGAATMTGLPLTSANTTPEYGAVQDFLANNMSSLTSAPMVQAAPNGTVGNLYETGATGYGNLTDANFTNTSLLIGTLIYATP